MAHIVIADDTNAYTGRSPETMPLGGTESSVIHLAQALAARGHAVTALTGTTERLVHAGVAWAPLGDAGTLRDVDLYLAVQHPRLFGLVRRPRKLAVWLAWRVNNLRHYKNIPAMWRHRPVPVFVSAWQATEYARVLPRAEPRIVIPHAIEESWRGLPPLPAPPPRRAVYASMPGRGLPWLLPVWQEAVLPQVPDAELHILGLKAFGEPYSGGVPRLPWIDALDATARASLRIHPTLPRAEQRDVMRSARVFLYGGHISEVFCLAAAEAQALGVPAVVRPVTVLPERVIDEVTGFVRDDASGFADAAVRLLTDDALWRAQHLASLERQQGPSWAEVAARFEDALLP